MDDQGKRLVIALVISFAFLFVYQRYFLPPAPTTTQEAPQETVPVVTEEISPAPEAAVAPYEPLEPISAAEEKTINITTPLYRASLTNLGGVISSFKLLDYRQDIKSFCAKGK